MIINNRLDRPIPMTNRTRILNPTFRENYHCDMRRFHNYRETLTTEGVFKPNKPEPIKIETKDLGADIMKRFEDILKKQKQFEFKLK